MGRTYAWFIPCCCSNKYWGMTIIEKAQNLQTRYNHSWDLYLGLLKCIHLRFVTFREGNIIVNYYLATWNVDASLLCRLIKWNTSWKHGHKILTSCFWGIVGCFCSAFQNYSGFQNFLEVISSLILWQWKSWKRQVSFSIGRWLTNHSVCLISMYITFEAIFGNIGKMWRISQLS